MTFHANSLMLKRSKWESQQLHYTGTCRRRKRSSRSAFTRCLTTSHYDFSFKVPPTYTLDLPLTL